MSRTHSFASTLQAILLAFTGYSFFAFADILAKWLTQDFTPLQILAVSNIAGLILVTLWIICGYGFKALIPVCWKLHLLRGINASIGTFFVFKALALIPLADFYGIVFLAPLIIAIVSSFMFKERIGIHRLIAIVAGFFGVFILAGPQFDTLNQGMIYMFIAVFFVAMNGILARKLGHEPVLPHYAFSPFLIGAICFTAMTWNDFKMPDNGLYGFLLLATAPLYLIAMVCYCLGYAKAPAASVVAPFHYTQMIWGVLFGYILFDEIPTTTTALGSSIIIASGLYLLWREHISHSASVRAAA